MLQNTGALVLGMVEARNPDASNIFRSRNTILRETPQLEGDFGCIVGAMP